ncbi:UNVERIFIED_CONTAM: hypothetical protein Sradi_5761700 [Sesamum radiatum]|uniref:Uncharacterized protein n=1 Tax=Sesamum radiatum TaxID=300843 RepID=A0AAW2L3Y2_SESRA
MKVFEEVLSLGRSSTGPKALGRGGMDTGMDLSSNRNKRRPDSDLQSLGVARYFSILLLIHGIIRILHRNSHLELKFSTDGAN